VVERLRDFRLRQRAHGSEQFVAELSADRRADLCDAPRARKPIQPRRE
jgi:hypothetical protein